jgi:hypothetical protein
VSDKIGPTKNDSSDLNIPLDQNKNSISQFLKPVDKQLEIKKEIQPEPAHDEKKVTFQILTVNYIANSS